MSLSAASNKIIYTGDDATTVFAIPFALPSGSTGTDVWVYVVDDEGTVTRLTSNYTVNVGTMEVTYPLVAGVAPLDPGVAALPSNWQIVLYRMEPLEQTLQLINTGYLDRPSLEAALDRIVMMIQQLNEMIGRATKVPINVPGDDDTPVTPPVIATMLHATGTLAELVAISDANPTAPYFGLATDVGGGQTVYYPGYASTSGINGTGWYAIGGGI